MQTFPFLVTMVNEKYIIQGLDMVFCTVVSFFVQSTFELKTKKKKKKKLNGKMNVREINNLKKNWLA